MQLLASPIKPVPTPWLRGEATHEHGWIVLDPSRSAEYQPYEEGDLLWDLAAIRRPIDAVEFVRRYGLLRHGPGSSDFRERFSDWEQEARTLTGYLMLYRALRGALQGDGESLEELRDTWEPNLRPLPSPRGQRLDVSALYRPASEFIAAGISAGLQGAEERVSAAASWENATTGERGNPGAFLLVASTPHLLGHAYHQFALLVVNQKPVAICIACGRVYLVTDPRQNYCTPACARRTRARRHYIKHRQANGTLFDRSDGQQQRSE